MAAGHLRSANTAKNQKTRFIPRNRFFFFIFFFLLSIDCFCLGFLLFFVTDRRPDSEKGGAGSFSTANPLYMLVFSFVFLFFSCCYGVECFITTKEGEKKRDGNVRESRVLLLSSFSFVLLTRSDPSS